MDKLYAFTPQQLYKLLKETIDLYQEDIDKHGKRPQIARLDAVTGAVDGLDAEAELIANGERITPTFTLVEAASV